MADGQIVSQATIEIKSRWTDEILVSSDLATLRDALEAAVRRGADLGGAYLRRAYLRRADLGGADLGGADLGGAYLRGADLRGADLRGADLGEGITFNWSSHELIAEILLRAAGKDVAKRKVAGLILVSRDWCWESFTKLKRDPLFGWALDTMATYVRGGDGAPEILRKRAAKGAR